MNALLAGLLLIAGQQAAGVPAYVTQSPVADWWALATPDGRWAVQLAEDCEAIQPDTNILIVGSPEDPDVQLVADTGEACGLVQQRWVSDAPCAQNHLGVCDVWYDGGAR